MAVVGAYPFAASWVILLVSCISCTDAVTVRIKVGQNAGYMMKCILLGTPWPAVYSVSNGTWHHTRLERYGTNLALHFLKRTVANRC